MVLSARSPAKLAGTLVALVLHSVSLHAAAASASAQAPASSATSTEDPALHRARALFDEAKAAKGSGDSALARSKASEAIDALLSEGDGRDSDARILMLFELGNFADTAGELKAAERARRRALEARLATLPPEHVGVQMAYLSLASSLYRQGDIAGARQMMEQVVGVFEHTLTPEHSLLQTARMNLAVMLDTQGDLEGARSLYEQVLEVRLRTLPPEHPDLQLVRTNLAVTLSTLGDLAGARALEEQVLEIYTRTLPPDHPRLRSVRANLATVLYRQGDLPAALALQRQVLEADARSLPPDHPDVLSGRRNFAAMLKARGDLPAARAIEEQVLEVESRTLPPEHPSLQNTRNNLANTLQALGDLSAARALYEQVVAVRSRTLPAEHPDLQRVRANLAVVLKTQGDLVGARSLEAEVVEIRTRTLPLEHPELQSARLNLAATLDLQGDVDAARATLEQVVEVFERTLPPDHRDLQLARLDLAGSLKNQGNFEPARALEQLALDVLARTCPSEDPDVQAARASLCFTIALGAEQRREKTRAPADEKADGDFVELATTFARSCIQSARLATCSSSGREAEERCSNLQEELSRSLSFAAGCGVFAPDPSLTRDAFILSETTRGAALASARIARLARSQERAADLLKEIRSAGEELARLVRSGANADAYDAALAKRDRVQRELVQAASASPEAASLLAELDPEAVSERLSEKDAIVAFRRYKRSEIAAGEWKIRSTESLCAFVLRKNEKLARVELGAILPIEEAVKEWRDALGMPRERGMAAAADEGRDLAARETGVRLHRLVFDPLLPALGSANRIIVLLDDVLHSVPLDALPAELNAESKASSKAGTELLGDRYRFEQRLSLAEVFDTPVGAHRFATLVALGGAMFNSEPLPPSAEETASLEAAAEERSEVASLLRGGAWARGFAPLTYTGLEAREIAALFEEVVGKGANGATSSVVLEKRKASRAAVEELAPKAQFLHLATHGWFAPESIQSWDDAENRGVSPALGARMSAEERVRGSSPMLLCGLALAGANLPPDATGCYPGLVTAEEISSWDLSSCELAVLSACDTNVGERRAGQGVASLQKALHMAGARSVITSLWKVPDEATKELMLDFYRRLWVEKKPKSQALWEAKKKLRGAKDERGEGKYTTRDWAAWVLTGAQD